ncbi:enoyl-CoA hydratase/isomerase family protein [Roseomonas sp. WA12]
MTISLEIRGRVALLTVERPEAQNALDLDTIRMLRSLLVDFRDRDDLLVAVITGRGPKAFCAGADLKKTTTSAASFAEALPRSREAAATMGLYTRLMELADLEIWKPLIAAVNGYCLGGGLELALQCDLRLAAENATFGLPEPIVGSIPGVSGVHRLMRAIPAAQAMQMALTGRPLSARDALNWGLVSEVTAPEALLDRALEIAGQIAGNGPLAVQAIKRLARQTSHLSDADAHQLTELVWGTIRDSQDRAEGRAAFAAKRSPIFRGA